MFFRAKSLVYRSVCIILAYTILHSGIVGDLFSAKEALASELNMPVLGSLVQLSEDYDMALLRGIKYDSANPFQMDFIIDQGSTMQVSDEEAAKLVRYFLTALTVAQDKLWVNLSPYEADRIIDDSLVDTETGETLLKQDYLLKQLSASLTYPETQIGQKYWNGIAGMQNSSSALNKIWISTDTVELYDSADTVFIKDAVLKVQTEADYHNKEQSETSSDVIANVLLPEIARDVNKGKNFAPLRQLYHSAILAQWFKKKFADSLFNFYYDSQKTAGIDVADPLNKETVFNKYVEAFEKGTYNYTRKEKDQSSNTLVKKNYFSGGSNLGLKDSMVKKVNSSAVMAEFSDLNVNVYKTAGQVEIDSETIDIEELVELETPLLDSYGDNEAEVIIKDADQILNDELQALDELDAMLEKLSSSVNSMEEGTNKEYAKILVNTIKDIKAAIVHDFNEMNKEYEQLTSDLKGNQVRFYSLISLVTLIGAVVTAFAVKLEDAQLLTPISIIMFALSVFSAYNAYVEKNTIYDERKEPLLKGVYDQSYAHHREKIARWSKEQLVLAENKKEFATIAYALLATIGNGNGYDVFADVQDNHFYREISVWFNRHIKTGVEAENWRDYLIDELGETELVNEIDQNIKLINTELSEITEFDVKQSSGVMAISIEEDRQLAITLVDVFIKGIYNELKLDYDGVNQNYIKDNKIKLSEKDLEEIVNHSNANTLQRMAGSVLNSLGNEKEFVAAAYTLMVLIGQDNSEHIFAQTHDSLLYNKVIANQKSYSLDVNKTISWAIYLSKVLGEDNLLSAVNKRIKLIDNTKANIIEFKESSALYDVDGIIETLSSSLLVQKDESKRNELSKLVERAKGLSEEINKVQKEIYFESDKGKALEKAFSKIKKLSLALWAVLTVAVTIADIHESSFLFSLGGLAAYKLVEAIVHGAKQGFIRHDQQINVALFLKEKFNEIEEEFGTKIDRTSLLFLLKGSAPWIVKEYIFLLTGDDTELNKLHDYFIGTRSDKQDAVKYDNEWAKVLGEERISELREIINNSSEEDNQSSGILQFDMMTQFYEHLIQLPKYYTDDTVLMVEKNNLRDEIKFWLERWFEEGVEDVYQLALASYTAASFGYLDELKELALTRFATSSDKNVEEFANVIMQMDATTLRDYQFYPEVIRDNPQVRSSFKKVLELVRLKQHYRVAYAKKLEFENGFAELSSAVEQMPEGELKTASSNILDTVNSMYTSLKASNERNFRRLDEVKVRDNVHFNNMILWISGLTTMMLLVTVLGMLVSGYVDGNFTERLEGVKALAKATPYLLAVAALMGWSKIGMNQMIDKAIMKELNKEFLVIFKSSLIQAENSKEIATLIHSSWDLWDEKTRTEIYDSLSNNHLAYPILDYFLNEQNDVTDQESWKTFINDEQLLEQIENQVEKLFSSSSVDLADVFEENYRFDAVDPERSSLFDDPTEITEDDVDRFLKDAGYKIDELSSAVANMPEGELKTISSNIMEIAQGMYQEMLSLSTQYENEKFEEKKIKNNKLNNLAKLSGIAFTLFLMFEVVMFVVLQNSNIENVKVDGIGRDMIITGASLAFVLALVNFTFTASTNKTLNDKYRERLSHELETLFEKYILYYTKTSKEIAVLVYTGWEFIDVNRLPVIMEQLEYNRQTQLLLDFFAKEEYDITNKGHWEDFIGLDRVLDDLDKLKSDKRLSYEESIEKMSSAMSLYLYELYSDLKKETEQSIKARRGTYDAGSIFAKTIGAVGLLGAMSQLVAITKEAFDPSILEGSLIFLVGGVLAVLFLEFMARVGDRFKLNDQDLVALRNRLEPFIDPKHIKSAEDLAFVAYFCANLGMHDKVREYVNNSSITDTFMYNLKKQINEARDWELKERLTYKSFIGNDKLEGIDYILTKTSSAINPVVEALLVSDAKAAIDGFVNVDTRINELVHENVTRESFLEELDKEIKTQMVNYSFNRSPAIFLYLLKNKYPQVVNALLQTKAQDPKYKDLYQEFVLRNKVLFDKSVWESILGEDNIKYLENEFTKSKPENSNEINLEINFSSAVNDLDDYLVRGSFDRDNEEKAPYITDQDGERIDPSFLRYSDEHDAQSRSEFSSSVKAEEEDAGHRRTLDKGDLMNPEAVRNSYIVKLGEKIPLKQKILAIGALVVAVVGMIKSAQTVDTSFDAKELDLTPKKQIELKEDSLQSNAINGGIDLNGTLDDVEVYSSTVAISLDSKLIDQIQGLNFRFVGQARTVPLHKILGVPATI